METVGTEKGSSLQNSAIRRHYLPACGSPVSKAHHSHVLHEGMGHMGLERTLDLVRSRLYWLNITVDAGKKI